MSLLPFLSDDHLYYATQKLLDAACRAEKGVERNPYRNVIDPFSALVDCARQKISTDDWMKQEKARQVQKGMQNALGEFHQDILGFMKGWKNGGKGGSYDVIHQERKIIAEVKNKYNTMNARSALSVYDSLSRHLDYSGNAITTAYVVEIIPKHPQPYITPFRPTERGTPRPQREDILRIDGQSFYTLASGDDTALEQLYGVLPSVLANMLGLSKQAIVDEHVYWDMFQRAYKQFK
ncbi:MAG: Eco47II family restriction endonuclease [Candidatus Saccharimonadales bacterium]|nr:Eco47II family restriction endonuclease [Candidatus Saccharibacteria bacterium]